MFHKSDLAINSLWIPYDHRKSISNSSQQGAETPVTQGLERTSRSKTRAALSPHLKQAGRYRLSHKALGKHLENLWEVHTSLIYKLREKT